MILSPPHFGDKHAEAPNVPSCQTHTDSTYGVDGKIVKTEKDV